MVTYSNTYNISIFVTNYASCHLLDFLIHFIFSPLNFYLKILNYIRAILYILTFLNNYKKNYEINDFK